MQEMIQALNEDHAIIAQNINELERLIDVDPALSFPQIYQLQSFFDEYTFGQHHQREEKILYEWMLGQNKNADNSLIKAIIEEHELLEGLSRDIRREVGHFLEKKPGKTVLTILSDLSYFIFKYREHIDKEEKFIFAIASALIPVEKGHH